MPGFDLMHSLVARSSWPQPATETVIRIEIWDQKNAAVYATLPEPVFNILSEEFSGTDGVNVRTEIQSRVTVDEANALAKELAIEKGGKDLVTLVEGQADANGNMVYQVSKGDGHSWKIRVVRHVSE